jgi:hypothetical protein
MSHLIVRYKYTHVSDERNASIFKVENKPIQRQARRKEETEICLELCLLSTLKIEAVEMSVNYQTEWSNVT